jgi:hypothetical protein
MIPGEDTGQDSRTTRHRRAAASEWSTVFFIVQLSMLHWFDSLHISPVFSNSININYYSDDQIAIRPYDDAFVHWRRPAGPWQLDCCTRPTHVPRLLKVGLKKIRSQNVYNSGKLPG